MYLHWGKNRKIKLDNCKKTSQTFWDLITIHTIMAILKIQRFINVGVLQVSEWDIILCVPRKIMAVSSYSTYPAWSGFHICHTAMHDTSSFSVNNEEPDGQRLHFIIIQMLNVCILFLEGDGSFSYLSSYSLAKYLARCKDPVSVCCINEGQKLKNRTVLSLTVVFGMERRERK